MKRSVILASLALASTLAVAHPGNVKGNGLLQMPNAWASQGPNGNDNVNGNVIGDDNKSANFNQNGNSRNGNSQNR